jgi:hypothetical protein
MLQDMTLKHNHLITHTRIEALEKTNTQLKHVWITGHENKNEIILNESKRFSSCLIEQHQHMYAGTAQLSIGVCSTFWSLYFWGKKP